MRRILSLVFAIALAASAPAQIGTRTWCDAGAFGDFHIVIPKDASAELEAAAKDFQRYWKLYTARDIGISHENGAQLNIWLGAAAAKALLKPGDLDGLGDEGFVVRTFTPNKRQLEIGAQKQLIVAGATDAGTANAVHDFFTRIFGVQFAAPGVVLPRPREFEVRTIEHRYAPPFPQRILSRAPFDAKPEAMAEYRRAQHLRRDGKPAQDFAPAFARHGLMSLLPPEKYFAAQPEIYALPSGAQARIATGICPSNPKTAEILAEELSALIAADARIDEPARKRAALLCNDPARNVWSLSLAPGATPCACPACKAIDDAEASPMGAMLTLVNRVAEELARRYPERGLRIHTLASGPLRKPPATVKPAANVIVEVSNLGTNAARPLRDQYDPLNRDFLSELRAWSKCTKSLYLWYVACNLANPLAPHPNLDVLSADFQLFAQVPLAGIDAQAGQDDASPYQELGAVRAWILARLLWDPDTDIANLLPELLRMYYGPAANAVSQYSVLLRNAARDAQQPLRVDAIPVWWTAETAGRAQALWLQAGKLPLQAPALRRLQFEALPALALLDCSSPGAFEKRLAELKPGDGAKLLEAAANLCRK